MHPSLAKEKNRLYWDVERPSGVGDAFYEEPRDGAGRGFGEWHG
jgi:hypothetical protein